jgi:hypothetical protein
MTSSNQCDPLSDHDDDIVDNEMASTTEQLREGWDSASLSTTSTNDHSNQSDKGREVGQGPEPTGSCHFLSIIC